MRRALALMAVAVALTACGQNQGEVYSAEPLLTPAMAEGAPRLRPGLWVSDETNCAFDETKPLGAWPDCAYAVVIRGDEILTGPNRQGVLRQKYVLSAGYPRVMQARTAYDGEVEEPRYYGVRPVRIEGDIVAFKRWSVSCSPPPPSQHDGSAGKLAAGASKTEGVLVGEDGRCRIADRDQLQRALLASEGWEKPPELRWVRESET